MKLKELKIKSFKGIRDFTMTPDGQNVSIFAENSAGKTSVADGVAWLLYNQDSRGDSFLPKPLDAKGEPIHNVNSEVEAVFLLDDSETITLKKSFKENWVKRRNSPKKTFTGHSTSYWIDGVPLKESLYKKRLSEIAPESVFKLLTSTRYFSEGLHWQERRSILLDICGDISDADIIKSNPALSRIVEILDGKSLEDQKKIITAQKTKLNKELETLPVRIDEVEKGQSDITNLNLSTIEKELSEISKALTEKNEEAARIESGGEIAEKIKKQREIESRLLEIENKVSAAQNWAEAERRKKVSEFETVQRKELSGLEATLENEKIARDKTLKAINNRDAGNKAAEQEMIKLREEWNTVNGEAWNDASPFCPTCGTDLIKHSTKKSQEIKETFHVKKATELDRINQTGRGIGNEVTERKNQNETDQSNIGLYEETIEEITGQINKIKEQTPESAKETEETIDKEQEALELDLTELKLNIEGLRSGNVMIAGKVQAEIFALSERQTAENLKKQTLGSHAKDQKRIKELGEQQKAVAGEYEKLEEMLFIMDEFLRQKAKLLEDKVNSKFKLANFSLFEIQVNGALNPICETTYDGIGWHSGLNNSSQNNVGVDVINTLNEHYGLTMPLMIDNAESILEVIPSTSQIIKLVVSETVQCTKCKWTGLHSETNKELDDNNIVTKEICPKCGGSIKEYKGLVVRNE